MPLLGQTKNDHYVLYPDEEKSELMDKKTAKDYAQIFGGVVYTTKPKYYIFILDIRVKVPYNVYEKFDGRRREYTRLA